MFIKLFKYKIHYGGGKYTISYGWWIFKRFVRVKSTTPKPYDKIATWNSRKDAEKFKKAVEEDQHYNFTDSG